MTPNGDGAILRRNMWFPLSLKSIRGSIGQHNPKVYMRGFFYCPVQQRRVKAYVTGGIFFLYLWLWGQVVNTDNRPKYWHTKGVGRLNHVQKVFQRGSKREASLRVVYDITLSWMWKATIFVLLGILSNNMLKIFSCHGIIKSTDLWRNIIVLPIFKIKYLVLCDNFQAIFWPKSLSHANQIQFWFLFKNPVLYHFLPAVKRHGHAEL